LFRLGEGRFGFRSGGLRFWLWRRSLGAAKQRPAVIVRQTFRADHARQESAIGQILLDGAKRILAGQKRRAHPVRPIVTADQGRFLDVHFEDDVSLIKLWSAREISKREKEAGDRAKDQDPQLLQNGVPEMTEIGAIARLKTDVA
jgi:hypothetical protein